MLDFSTSFVIDIFFTADFQRMTSCPFVIDTEVETQKIKELCKVVQLTGSGFKVESRF